MNANEVLANLGEEILGGQRGQYRRLHPNDHVNLHQSTNDVYPSACRMAVILAWPRLHSALDGLEGAYRDKAREFEHLPRLARTCLQDAVPTTWGEFFTAWTGFVGRRRALLADAIDRLHTINLGGTIVGRRSDAPAAYQERILPVLGEVCADPAYRQALDLFDAAQNADDLGEVSAHLDLLARGLVKQAQDLRLLASGPEAGLGELHLPPVQPGSSIMPGKINPVIPEFLIQLCLRVGGLHAACAAGLEHAELDLNVWESLMACSILDALELLETGVEVFTQRCITGIQVDGPRSAEYAGSSMALLTTLAQRHGYAAITALWKRSGGDVEQFLQLLHAAGLE
jgi:aspartate ammonia-lyase